MKGTFDIIIHARGKGTLDKGDKNSLAIRESVPVAIVVYMISGSTVRRLKTSRIMKRRRRSSMTEKVKKRRNTVYLPEDLLVDILSRVPQASLASTSKGWNSCNTLIFRNN